MGATQPVRTLARARTLEDRPEDDEACTTRALGMAIRTAVEALAMADAGRLGGTRTDRFRDLELDRGLLSGDHLAESA